MLPPINKSPLPVQAALYDCDSELDIIRLVFDENLTLSKPASYFLTNKSYLNASAIVSVLAETFLRDTSSQKIVELGLLFSKRTPSFAVFGNLIVFFTCICFHSVSFKPTR